ncbi:uroporphyrinogen-III synthase [Paracoccaceae bacterium]|nr:uroporphyrinogen-III synthase [Paracoccaceae bacterium]
MLEQEKFNGKVLILPLLEIDFLKTSIDVKGADVLVVTSVYALEKLKMELQNSETPIFAVGQRCDEFLKEIGATNSFIYSNVKHLVNGFKNHYRNKRPLVFYLRGDEISYDLKADLLKHDFNCEEYVVYKQRRNILKKELAQILSGENLEGIALFSEKSVDSLIKAAPRRSLDKIFFCFSKKIENRLRSGLDKDIRCKTIQEPLISNMVNMIVKEYSYY